MWLSLALLFELLSPPKSPNVVCDSKVFEYKGVEVKRQTKYSVLARVHAAVRDEQTGLWTAVADPVWEGSASVVVTEER